MNRACENDPHDLAEASPLPAQLPVILPAQEPAHQVAQEPAPIQEQPAQLPALLPAINPAQENALHDLLVDLAEQEQQFIRLHGRPSNNSFYFFAAALAAVPRGERMGRLTAATMPQSLNPVELMRAELAKRLAEKVQA